MWVRYLLCLAMFAYFMKRRSLRTTHKGFVGSHRKKIKLRCPESGCNEKAKGYDIEACWDEEDQPVWAVSYECVEGHRFIAEYERDVEEQSTEAA